MLEKNGKISGDESTPKKLYLREVKRNLRTDLSMSSDDYIFKRDGKFTKEIPSVITKNPKEKEGTFEKLQLGNFSAATLHRSWLISSNHHVSCSQGRGSTGGVGGAPEAALRRDQVNVLNELERPSVCYSTPPQALQAKPPPRLSARRKCISSREPPFPSHQGAPSDRGGLDTTPSQSGVPEVTSSAL